MSAPSIAKYRKVKRLRASACKHNVRIWIVAQQFQFVARFLQFLLQFQRNNSTAMWIEGVLCQALHNGVDNNLWFVVGGRCIVQVNHVFLAITTVFNLLVPKSLGCRLFLQTSLVVAKKSAVQVERVVSLTIFFAYYIVRRYFCPMTKVTGHFVFCWWMLPLT